MAAFLSPRGGSQTTDSRMRRSAIPAIQDVQLAPNTNYAKYNPRSIASGNNIMAFTEPVLRHSSSAISVTSRWLVLVRSGSLAAGGSLSPARPPMALMCWFRASWPLPRGRKGCHRAAGGGGRNGAMLAAALPTVVARRASGLWCRASRSSDPALRRRAAASVANTCAANSPHLDRVTGLAALFGLICHRRSAL